MNELLQNAIHIGLRINKKKFGLHKEEQPDGNTGWIVVNRKGQYLFNDIWSSVQREYFNSAEEAYQELLLVNPIEYSSESM